MEKEERFLRFLKKHFGFEVSGLFYQKGVRIANQEVISSPIRGWKGYAACDGGFNPTNAFIFNFGHLAKRNVLALNEEEAKRFVAGEDLFINLGNKPKHIIPTFNGFPLGAAFYDGEKIVNKLPKKRTRHIINKLLMKR